MTAASLKGCSKIGFQWFLKTPEIERILDEDHRLANVTNEN